MKQTERKNKNRLFKLLLFALVMLLPIGAWGQTNCGLFIGDYEGTNPVGVRVTSENASNITHACIKSGKVSFESASRTLTLEDATIDGSIYSYGDLTIKLVGDNYVTATDSSAIVCEISAAAQNLTIKGTGRLMAVPYSDVCVKGFNTPSYEDGQKLLIGDLYYTSVIGTQLFSGGDGSYDTPYLIGSVADLKNLSIYVKMTLLSNKYYKLTDDLNCSGLSGFEPIGSNTSPFKGTFNGNNKTISNLSLSNQSSNVGLFGQLGDYDGNSGTVNNLIIKDCTFNGIGSYCGAIAGYVASGDVFDCKVTGETKVSCVGESGANGVYAGAIVGGCAGAAFRNNTYEFSVVTSTKIGTADAVEKKDYVHRGMGKEDSSTGDCDVFADNGAVMYTKPVHWDDFSNGSVAASENNQYIINGSSSERYIYIAPGETVTLSVTPKINYHADSVQVIYGAPDEVKFDATLESVNNGKYIYTFEMPDDEATVNVKFESGTGYYLYIGGTQVTTANQNDVFDDGKVAFTVEDGQTPIYKLTLKGAELTEPIKIGLDNLTIDIQNANSITTTETCIQKIDGTDPAPAITFKSTSAAAGDSLSLKGASGVYGVGYGTFSISDELALILKKDGYIYSNQYHFTDGSTKEAKLVPSYGITVGGMQIYEGNANDVIGDGIGNGNDRGMVSFNKATSTLTLKNANLSGIIRSSLPNLTIELIGNNSISSGGERTLQAGSAVNMTIQSSADVKGSLSLHKSYDHNELGNFVDNNVNLTIATPLSVISGDLTNDYVDNDYYATIGQSYGITINTESGSVVVTSANRKNVLNENLSIPTVQFDGLHTLILNDATLKSIVIGSNPSFASTGLTIYLAGEDDQLSLDGTSTIIDDTGLKAIYKDGDGDNINVTFSTDRENPGKLTCSYSDATNLFPKVNAFYYNLAPNVNTVTQRVTIMQSMQPIVSTNDPESVPNGTNDDPDTPGVGLGADIENNNTSQLTNGVVKNNILYVLPDANDGFYQEGSDKLVFLNSIMTDDAVKAVAADVEDNKLFPATPDFAARFKGLCFLVPAGSGDIIVETNTIESGKLHICLGRNDVREVPVTTDMTENTIRYSFTKDTYVYLYNAAAAQGTELASRFDGSHRAPGKKMTTTTTIRRTGVRASASSGGSIASAPEPPLNPKTLTKADVDAALASVDGVYDLSFTDGDYVDIADDAFTSLSDDTYKGATFIDLGQTSIIDQKVDRTKAPFNKLPNGTFVYLPVGNDMSTESTAKIENVVIGTVCPDMQLSESRPFKAAIDFTAGKAKMDRTFVIDQRSSIFLPFAIDKDAVSGLGTFYEFTGVTDGKVIMTPLAEGKGTEANIPYMFKAAKESLSFEMVDVKSVLAETPSHDGVTFEGTYQQIDILSTSDFQYYCFMNDDGKFVHVVDQPVTVKPFRAYLVKSGSVSLSNVFDIDWGDDTTGLNEIRSKVTEVRSDVFFDLQGRQVKNPTTKGIYIQNGKKVVIK